ncbi:MAG: penicillin-binding protein 2, partial [Pseudomonadota bacterium]
MSEQLTMAPDASRLNLDGKGKTAVNQAQSRVILTMFVVGIFYMVIVGRLVMLGFTEADAKIATLAPDIAITATRPDIRDRNGEMLATDIVTSSLFAEPRRIVDADEAVEKLVTVLPDLDVKSVYKRLTSNAGFVWLKRELTPLKESEIL